MRWLILLLAGIVHAQTFSSDLFPASLLAPIQLLMLATLFGYIFAQPRYAIRYSFAFSISHFCSGIYWLFISMNTYGGLSAPLAAAAVFLLSFYLSLYPMLAGAIFRYLSKKISSTDRVTKDFNSPLSTTNTGTSPSTPKAAATVGNAILIASAWALCEWLRGTVLTGFPWLNIAYAHVDGPLSGWASLWGAYGVAWLAAFIAALLVVGVLRFSWQKWMLVALILIAGQLVKSFPWSSPIGDALPVRLVQGNIDQHEKFSPITMLPSIMRNFELANQPAKNPFNPPKVVIFPETIIPTYQNQLPPEIWQHIIDQARVQQATYFIGSAYAEDSLSGVPMITNSILVVDGTTPIEALYRGGVPHYDKRHLVPFGEYIPTGFHWFVHALGIPLGDFNLGNRLQANILINQQALAPNICYEDIFGEELLNDLFPTTLSTSMGIQPYPGATILFNVSNLGWFGNSSALGQHLQMARMRAVETARPMLRATNTGATAYINEKGDIVDKLPYLQAGVLDVDIQGMTGLTPYAQAKNAPFLIFVVFTLIVATIQRIRKRRQ
ncbi:apolipoprotein N-acyltransferase [Pelistega europaea]|nr:apolipoprotein N-acyltransferase [Pelistega europaea]